ncbi:MAG: methionyl-tRNA formyltransferase [Clostridia bacterium]|nr:methionyl-tRNA formyltransferase [Clostridia bacterium]
MRIVFMGTPDFAVPCLQRLIDTGHDVTGVFTQPDKPKGRHGILTPPPVKELALKYNIPVFQPVKMKDGTALEMLRSVSPELVIVVAYGKILPPDILHLPEYGCINIHASLLPELRGAAPIQWAILNGFEKTGVTSMQMDEGLDTGDMLMKDEIPIGDDMNAEELHDALSALGADVMEKTIDALIEGKLSPVKQSGESSYASMLSKELSPVDWNKPAREVHNHIRGLYGWPCASAKLGGRIVKIHRSAVDGETDKKPGEIVQKDGCLKVACGDGRAIEILNLQAENKKAMSAADYLRGNPIGEDRFD